MKTAILLLALCLPASAQTFVNYTITNFIQTPYVRTDKIIDVPSSTLFKIVSVEASADEGANVCVEYPQSTNQILVAESDWNQPIVKPFVLGPAKIHLLGGGDNANQDICVLLGEISPVNVAPDLSGLAVQPAGHVASVQIETSTNLTAWQTTAPGTFPATNSAAFFRLKFDVN